MSLKQFAIYTVFLFNVADSFDVRGFLLSCEAGGVKLYATVPDDAVNGHMVLDGNKLLIDLYDFSKPVARDARGKNPHAAFSELLGNKQDYRALLQAAIAENGG